MDDIDVMLDNEPEPTPEQKAALEADYSQWLHARGEKDRKIAALTAELASARDAYVNMGTERDNSLVEADGLRKERDQLRRALAAVEFAGPTQTCLQCKYPASFNHAPDCIVGLALKANQ